MTKAYRIGSLAQDVETGIKIIAAYPTADARYMTLETPVGTDYQVPAGKIFYITKLSGAGSAANAGFQIGYGDDGVADGAAAPTTPLFMTEIYWLPVTTTQYEFDVFIPIPAEKFPFAKAKTSGTLLNIQGIEITL